MDYLTILAMIIFGIPFIVLMMQMVISELLDTNVPYFMFLLFNGELTHFIAKRRLVKGDLVLISYRGKLRKAYINDLSFYNNTVTLNFEEEELNIKSTEFNRFHLARIKLPEYYNKATKILYSGEEK